MKLKAVAALGALASQATAYFDAREEDGLYILENDRLYVAVSKSKGTMTEVQLEGEDLLGPVDGNQGVLQLDCSCVPDGFWTPGSDDPVFELITGTDSEDAPFGGIVVTDTYPDTNQTLSQYYFLREAETGLHMFSRITYFNESTPYLRGLGEMRTMFRPSHDLWTHLSSSDGNWAPLPNSEDGVTVQDATTYLGETPDDPYVAQYSDYFTKYTFSELWRDHDVHGQYADGSTTGNGSVFGAWLVHNTVETYYGGPLHSDLTVDGIVYNYMVSGHHGAPVPNITHGLDRTFGPQYYHFNTGPSGTPLETLRADAAQYAEDPTWAADFYDTIAPHVPGYVPTAGRATFSANIELPSGAERPLAVLSEPGYDFQLNVNDPSARQYWADVDPYSGAVEIPRVIQGTYRLTVFADGVFGWFIDDEVEIAASGSTKQDFKWEEESAGEEIWRIGVPDKSAGEFRHGYAVNESTPLAPEQYRIYWGAYDFPNDYPEGLTYTVGESDPAVDFNYIHWSVFGGLGNHLRPEPVLEATVRNWTVAFDLTAEQLVDKETATLTVQFAGVKTANGNNKVPLPDEPFSNLPYTVAFNGADVETWIIPYYRSGSCGVRSEVVCQNFGHQFVFGADRLSEGRNELILSLPYNATGTETAILPPTTYVQYDALRMELI